MPSKPHYLDKAEMALVLSTFKGENYIVEKGRLGELAASLWKKKGLNEAGMIVTSGMDKVAVKFERDGVTGSFIVMDSLGTMQDSGVIPNVMSAVVEGLGKHGIETAGKLKFFCNHYARKKERQGRSTMAMFDLEHMMWQKNLADALDHAPFSIEREQIKLSHEVAGYEVPVTRFDFPPQFMECSQFADADDENGLQAYYERLKSKTDQISDDEVSKLEGKIAGLGAVITRHKKRDDEGREYNGYNDVVAEGHVKVAEEKRNELKERGELDNTLERVIPGYKCPSRPKSAPPSPRRGAGVKNQQRSSSVWGSDASALPEDVQPVRGTNYGAINGDSGVASIAAGILARREEEKESGCCPWFGF